MEHNKELRPTMSGSLPSFNNNNPYISISALHTSSTPNNGPGMMDKVFGTLNRCGRVVERASKQAENFTDNLWNHVRMSSSLVGVAMNRVVQGAKVVTQGGHDKVFQQMFGFLEGEKLLDEYACYISSPAGPIIGTLFISSKRLAFCSDRHICYYISLRQPQYLHYKAIVPLDQLSKVTPSANTLNPSEKHIEVLTEDGYKLIFMGFLFHDMAFKTLNETLYRYRNPPDQK